MLSKMKKGTKIGLILIFILLLAVNVFIAYSRYYQNVYYDSSPELVLAELLAKENRALTFYRNPCLIYAACERTAFPGYHRLEDREYTQFADPPADIGIGALLCLP